MSFEEYFVIIGLQSPNQVLPLMKMLRDHVQLLPWHQALTPMRAFLEKDKSLTRAQAVLLASLLGLAMLAPIWIGQFAPLYDYPDNKKGIARLTR